MSASRWTAALLLGVMWSVSATLTGIAQGLEGTSSLVIVALALALGWLLASSSQPGAAAAVVAGWIGLSLISLQIGRLGDEFRQLAGSLIQLILGLLNGIGPPLGPTVAEPAAFGQAIGTLLGGYRVLFRRSLSWMLDLVSGGSTVDPVASALAWSVLLWATACWAAWWVRRGERPLLAAAPPLALLGTTLYLSRSSHLYLLPPLAAALLLLAFAGMAARHRAWNAQAVPQPEGLLGSLALSAVPVTLLLVAAAGLASELSLVRLRDFGRRAGGQPVPVGNDLPDRLGLNLATRPGTGFEPMLVAGLPNRHLIGSGPELSEREVMTVTLTELPADGAIPRYSWRALTYDQYTGRGWLTSSLAVQRFEPDHLLIEEVPRNQRLVRQHVRAVGDLRGLAYAAGTLVSLDREFELAWRVLGQDPFAATLAAEAFWAESLLPEVTEVELRASGTNYPDYVAEHYLDLPSDLPMRVRALARDLTATAATPYERALAVETYLRSIPYTLDVEPPPTGRDVVDYFLFELRRGYCDYYASAMVVLARAAGLPARLVVGYFTGTPQPTEGTVSYRVTEAEAHSWVEVYFPEIGWVEFEPTAGRPALERPADRASAPPAGPLPPRLDQQVRAQQLSLFRRWVGWGAAGISSLALVALLAGSAAQARRLRRLPPAQAVTELYRRLAAGMVRLGTPLDPGHTPLELLSAYRVRAGAEDASGRLLTAAAEEANRLVEIHLAAAYGPRPVDARERSQAMRSWGRLRVRLWLALALSFLHGAWRRVRRSDAQGD